ncbi:MAG TPA: zf-HC2 domain-containing protein [Polyangia bacterium]|nr:zf-HC2 domain-containing protein [Polyangia bacterium]
MNCASAREVLPEVAGGELDGARAEEVREHARGCVSCGEELAELEATISLCRRAGAEPLPDGFALELHRKLVAAAPPERSRWRRLRDRLALRPFSFAASAAALSALLAAGGTFAGLRHFAASAPSPVIAARVPESKVALVKIDFVAEREVDDVSFELMLPDGLRFYSGGQQLAERTFRWTGKLERGSNPIPIAVKGPRAGRYRVVAHAVGPDLDLTHVVWLEVTT